MPWVNLNQIQIVFNENVSVQQNSLTLTGIDVPQYAFSGFSYNPSTFTATWTLTAPLGTDKLLIDLHSTGPAAVTDVAGHPLDGEWTNAVSVYPSGNGTPGGDFLFGFNTLPADVNGDGVVNGLDISAISANWGTTGNLALDSNGDGVINGLDIAAVSSNWLQSLTPGGGTGAAITGDLGSSASAATSIPLGQNSSRVTNSSDPTSAAIVEQHTEHVWFALGGDPRSLPASVPIAALVSSDNNRGAVPIGAFAPESMLSNPGTLQLLSVLAVSQPAQLDRQGVWQTTSAQDMGLLAQPVKTAVLWRDSELLQPVIDSSNHASSNHAEPGHLSLIAASYTLIGSDSDLMPNAHPVGPGGQAAGPAVDRGKVNITPTAVAIDRIMATESAGDATLDEFYSKWAAAAHSRPPDPTE